ncbi:MAG: FadR family transcriptional regulator [Enterovirga sp.]|nr:FadR family transcriptional regulator [Enterovirga sp.]
MVLDHNHSVTDSLQRLEEWLAGRPSGPAGRLPAERDLAERLNLSRAELRKALATVESQGRLVRHVGRGTFLRLGPADLADERPPARQGVERIASEERLPRTPLGDIASPRDLVQARLLLEPELAGLAALHATRLSLAAIEHEAAAVRGAADWAGYDAADSRLHAAIAAACGNALLVALDETLRAARRELNWGVLGERGPEPPSPDHPSVPQHAAVVAAIRARDRHGAVAALRHHLMVEAASLLGPGA